jgi:hypothetical protein
MIINLVRDCMKVGATAALAMAWSTIQATNAEPTGAAVRSAACHGKAFWIVFIVGLGFLVTRVLLALWLPHPSKDQEAVFRTVLSLAAASIGAVIPGLMKIESQIAETTISASGALTLFVLVYLLNPASPRQSGVIGESTKGAAPNPEDLQPLMKQLDELGGELRALSARVKLLELSHESRAQKVPSHLSEDTTGAAPLARKN